MRKIKSIISLVLALILACAAALPISAAGPLTGDSLYINTHIDAINSATGKNYLSDTGDTMDFLKTAKPTTRTRFTVLKRARDLQEPCIRRKPSLTAHIGKNLPKKHGKA